MTPAERVIERFGGATVIADILNCHPSTIYRWTYPEERGGRGGLIPSTAQRRLLDAAVERGIELHPDELVDGSIFY